MEDINTNNNNTYNNNIGVLVNAKEEYTKQLISILKTCIYQGIKSIYMDAKDICHQDNTPDNVLMIFQDLLSRIPKWSQDIINKEFERIANVSKCDYIDDLLKVVYVSHIKILTVVHSAQRNKKLSLKVPSGGHFIHLCYIECAREFWKDPYLFSDRGSKFEQQKNMRDSETMIAECINETIRKQLPVRNILKDFLNEPDEDINEEDETDIKEPVNKKYLKKLETVVKKELKSSNTLSGIDIELIRQVIREEMEGKPNTSIIKKELVDNVVEKIVEKANEASETNESSETNEGSGSDHSTIVNESNSNSKDSTELETDLVKQKKGKKEVKIEDKIDIIPRESNDAPPEKLKKENETKTETKTETIPVPETATKKSIHKEKEEQEEQEEQEEKEEQEEEHINISLSKILGDDNSSENNNSIEDENSIEVKNSNTLSINNIDEVNLNLDELDIDDNNYDHGHDDLNEIDIDDLDSVDLTISNTNSNANTNTSTSSEVKSNKDTKYIFFNDAK